MGLKQQSIGRTYPWHTTSLRSTGDSARIDNLVTGERIWLRDCPDFDNTYELIESQVTKANHAVFKQWLKLQREGGITEPTYSVSKYLVSYETFAPSMKTINSDELHEIIHKFWMHPRAIHHTEFHFLGIWKNPNTKLYEIEWNIGVDTWKDAQNIVCEKPQKCFWDLVEKKCICASCTEPSPWPCVVNQHHN